MTAEVLPPNVTCTARGAHQTPCFLLVEDPIMLVIPDVLAQAMWFAGTTDKRPIGVHRALIEVLRSL